MVLNTGVQGSAKRWALGCANPASWLPLTEGRKFTQPRANLLADPCTSLACRKGEEAAWGRRDLFEPLSISIRTLQLPSPKTQWFRFPFPSRAAGCVFFTCLPSTCGSLDYWEGYGFENATGTPRRLVLRKAAKPSFSRAPKSVTKLRNCRVYVSGLPPALTLPFHFGNVLISGRHFFFQGLSIE